MTKFRSCVPILEPLIGIVFSAVSSFIIFVYIIKAVKNSNFYETEYYEYSAIKRIAYFVLFLIITISLLMIIFFTLTLVTAGIIMNLKKLM